MPQTKQQVLRELTEDYLKSIDPLNPPSMDEIAGELIHKTWQEFSRCNLNFSDKSRRWKIPDHLEPAQIADVIMRLHHVAVIRFVQHKSRDEDLLAIYQQEGKDRGIYSTDHNTIDAIACKLYYSITKRELDEVRAALLRKAPLVTLYDAEHCKENLIAVNNGIFDYDTKQLLPFTPDEVFLSKCPVDYVAGAANPIIRNPDGTDWDVESWMKDLSDDNGVPELLWQIIGAAIRPNVSWNKSAWFFSESGNNGKGTLCQLIRNLCGEENTASISLCDFGKPFGLQQLISGISCILADENPVGTYVDDAAALKSVITGDVVTVNGKFKAPVSYRFRGFMIQCLNELPKVRDKSDSFYRRQLFVPFDKCFTGVERKYIKNDYLKRRDVLEYVLKRVLEMNYYEFDVPDVCREALNAYKIFNDPTLHFWKTFEDEFAWDFLPWTYLYDLYKAWFTEANPDGRTMSNVSFNHELKRVVKNQTDGTWEVVGDTRPGTMMSKPEPLSVQYNLTAWLSTRSGGPAERRAIPPLKTKYSGGLKRRTVYNASLPDGSAAKA